MAGYATEQRTRETVYISADHDYPMGFLFHGYHEQVPGLAENQLPHPRMTRRLLAPVWATAFISSPDKPIEIKGSTLRHAAEALNNFRWPPLRYNVNTVLRQRVLVDSAEELERMKTQRSEAYVNLMKLVSGPDIDLLVDVPDFFYSERLPRMLRDISHPEIAAALLSNDGQGNGGIIEHAADINNVIKPYEDHPEAEEKRTHLGPTWKYVASLPEIPVHLAPLNNPTGDLVPYPLLITMREFQRDNGIHVARVAFAADLRDDRTKPLREEDMYIFINVDFSQKLPSKLATTSNRTQTSHDAHVGTVDILRGKLLIEPLIHVPREATFYIGGAPTLEPEWKDRPLANSLEIVSRLFRQRADKTLTDNQFQSKLYPETIDDIHQFVGSIDAAQLSELDAAPPTLDTQIAREEIRNNLLMSMLVDPYGTMVHMELTGLWNFIRERKKGQNLPDARTILAGMPDAFSDGCKDLFEFPESFFKILDIDSFMIHKKYEGKTGFDVIDEGCYPGQDPTHRIERLFDLVTI